ncbi:MAG: amino acid ABC transporter permease [Burkholderiaceae bacterium]
MNAKLDFTILLRPEYLKMIIDGVLIMFWLTLLAWTLAMLVGVLLALMRMTNNRVAKIFVASYVEYHQNVPMLVQIFLWYFGVATLLPVQLQHWLNANQSEFIFAFIAVGLAMGAYISEDIRGGIRSIPKSQFEAARALGLSYIKTSRLVVLPQALRIALPTLVSHSVLLFKNTSLAMTIGVAELTYATREIESQSFRTIEVYFFSTATYLVISMLIMAFGQFLEHHLRIHSR